LAFTQKPTKTLNEIWEYIAADNIEAADRIVEEVFAAISSLVAFPNQGFKRTDLTSRPLRFHTVRNYVIVYAPDEQPLLVIAVLHGRRNPRTVAAILRGRQESQS
jgi:plasmid stabilization system protein ParE